MSADDGEAERRVILMPEEFLQKASKGDHNAYVIKLRHPRTQTCALFAVSQDSTQIFEMVKFSEHCRSWFINEFVEEDGSLYMVTPIDPLFLVLPYIMNQECFCPLSDLLQDEEYQNTRQLIKYCSQDQLSIICDTKDIDGLKVWRYNQDKVLAWLKCKTKMLVSTLISKNLNCGMGFTALGFDSGRDNKRISNDEMDLKYALGMILEYVPSQLEPIICEYLGVKLEKCSPKKGEKRKESARDVEPDEDYVLKDDKAKSAKQPKLTAAQKKLAKVDKTGMKVLSSFFKKKSPKKK